MGPSRKTPDPTDSWAQVELHRWQYGELPNPKDCRPLVIATGLRKMADALEYGCDGGDAKDMPAPTNVCSVLRYVSKMLTGERAETLIEMATALMEGCSKDAQAASIAAMPSPHVLCHALRDAAKQLELEREREVHGTPSPGRNEPCPCGSGKKHKKCCLKPAIAPTHDEKVQDTLAIINTAP